MCSKKGITPSTKEYSDKIELVRHLISEAQHLVIGVGSGLSAAGGLNYTDPELVKKWFPEYYSMGFRSLIEVQGKFWWFNRSKPEVYWGYWAKHIYHIRYESPALQPYKDLRKLASSKDFFIVSTNCDGQLEKSGFGRGEIFAPQGEYRFFQCSKPCSEKLYDNENMIRNMITNMPNPLEIRTEDIPTCPNCGKPLVPNLRCDSSFVETPHIQNIDDYAAFLDNCRGKHTAFLELGVGYNTPGIIRYPFEHFVELNPKAILIRANLGDASILSELYDNSVELQYDLRQVMADLTK